VGLRQCNDYLVFIGYFSTTRKVQIRTSYPQQLLNKPNVSPSKFNPNIYNMQVTIEPHNPAWLDEFQKTKSSLESILKDAPCQSIEHVGSTSIAGLPAKPVLDIDIIVTPAQLPAVRKALSDAGYLDCGEADIPGRFIFRQPGYGQKDAAFGHLGAGGEMRRNTYAIIEGCPALRNHLDIKRVLVENEALREEYGNVKKGLMGREFNNIGEYAHSKNKILWKLLAAAGWSEEDLAPVKKANDGSWRREQEAKEVLAKSEVAARMWSWGCLK